MKKISIIIPCYNEENSVKTISEDIINTAVRRVIAWKLKYLTNVECIDEPSDSNPQEIPKDNNTTLIAVLSVIGGLIIIGIIIFIVILISKIITIIIVIS